MASEPKPGMNIDIFETIEESNISFEDFYKALEPNDSVVIQSIDAYDKYKDRFESEEQFNGYYNALSQMAGHYNNLISTGTLYNPSYAEKTYPEAARGPMHGINVNRSFEYGTEQDLAQSSHVDRFGKRTSTFSQEQIAQLNNWYEVRNLDGSKSTRQGIPTTWDKFTGNIKLDYDDNGNPFYVSLDKNDPDRWKMQSASIWGTQKRYPGALDPLKQFASTAVIDMAQAIPQLTKLLTNDLPVALGNGIMMLHGEEDYFKYDNAWGATLQNIADQGEKWKFRPAEKTIEKGLFEDFHKSFSDISQGLASLVPQRAFAVAAVKLGVKSTAALKGVSIGTGTSQAINRFYRSAKEHGLSDFDAFAISMAALPGVALTERLTAGYITRGLGDESVNILRKNITEELGKYSKEALKTDAGKKAFSNKVWEKTLKNPSFLSSTQTGGNMVARVGKGFMYEGTQELLEDSWYATLESIYDNVQESMRGDNIQPGDSYYGWTVADKATELTGSFLLGGIVGGLTNLTIANAKQQEAREIERSILLEDPIKGYEKLTGLYAEMYKNGDFAQAGLDINGNQILHDKQGSTVDIEGIVPGMEAKYNQETNTTTLSTLNDMIYYQKIQDVSLTNETMKQIKNSGIDFNQALSNNISLMNKMLEHAEAISVAKKQVSELELQKSSEKDPTKLQTIESEISALNDTIKKEEGQYNTYVTIEPGTNRSKVYNDHVKNLGIGLQFAKDRTDEFFKSQGKTSITKEFRNSKEYTNAYLTNFNNDNFNFYSTSALVNEQFNKFVEKKNQDIEARKAQVTSLRDVYEEKALSLKLDEALNPKEVDNFASNIRNQLRDVFSGQDTLSFYPSSESQTRVKEEIQKVQASISDFVGSLGEEAEFDPTVIRQQETLSMLSQELDAASIASEGLFNYTEFEQGNIVKSTKTGDVGYVIKQLDNDMYSVKVGDEIRKVSGKDLMIEESGNINPESLYSEFLVEFVDSYVNTLENKIKAKGVGEEISQLQKQHDEIKEYLKVFSKAAKANNYLNNMPELRENVTTNDKLLTNDKYKPIVDRYDQFDKRINDIQIEINKLGSNSSVYNERVAQIHSRAKAQILKEMIANGFKPVFDKLNLTEKIESLPIIEVEKYDVANISDEKVAERLEIETQLKEIHEILYNNRAEVFKEVNVKAFVTYAYDVSNDDFGYVAADEDVNMLEAGRVFNPSQIVVDKQSHFNNISYYIQAVNNILKWSGINQREIDQIRIDNDYQNVYLSTNEQMNSSDELVSFMEKQLPILTWVNDAESAIFKKKNPKRNSHTLNLEVFNENIFSLRGRFGTGKSLQTFYEAIDIHSRLHAGHSFKVLIVGPSDTIRNNSRNAFKGKEQYTLEDVTPKEFFDKTDLSGYDFIVWEEASFLGKQDILSINEATSGTNSKVIFVGDKSQMQGVTAKDPRRWSEFSGYKSTPLYTVFSNDNPMIQRLSDFFANSIYGQSFIGSNPFTIKDMPLGYLAIDEETGKREGIKYVGTIKDVVNEYLATLDSQESVLIVLDENEYKAISKEYNLTGKALENIYVLDFKRDSSMPQNIQGQRKKNVFIAVDFANFKNAHTQVGHPSLFNAIGYTSVGRASESVTLIGDPKRMLSEKPTEWDYRPEPKEYPSQIEVQEWKNNLRATNGQEIKVEVKAKTNKVVEEKKKDKSEDDITELFGPATTLEEEVSNLEAKRKKQKKAKKEREVDIELSAAPIGKTFVAKDGSFAEVSRTFKANGRDYVVIDNKRMTISKFAKEYQEPVLEQVLETQLENKIEYFNTKKVIADHGGQLYAWGSYFTVMQDFMPKVTALEADKKRFANMVMKSLPTLEFELVYKKEGQIYGYDSSAKDFLLVRLKDNEKNLSKLEEKLLMMKEEPLVSDLLAQVQKGKVSNHYAYTMALKATEDTVDVNIPEINDLNSRLEALREQGRQSGKDLFVLGDISDIYNFGKSTVQYDRNAERKTPSEIQDMLNSDPIKRNVQLSPIVIMPFGNQIKMVQYFSFTGTPTKESSYIIYDGPKVNSDSLSMMLKQDLSTLDTIINLKDDNIESFNAKIKDLNITQLLLQNRKNVWSNPALAPLREYFKANTVFIDRTSPIGQKYNETKGISKEMKMLKDLITELQKGLNNNSKTFNKVANVMVGEGTSYFAPVKRSSVPGPYGYEIDMTTRELTTSAQDIHLPFAYTNISSFKVAKNEEKKTSSKFGKAFKRPEAKKMVVDDYYVSKEQAEETIKDLLGVDFLNNNTEFKVKVTANGVEAFGLMINGTIRLELSDKGIRYATTKHEVFHVVWNYLLDDATKVAIEKEVQNVTGNTGVNAEEWMARKYGRTSDFDMKPWYTLSGMLQRFNNLLNSIYDKFIAKTPLLNELFYNIDKGVYRDRDITLGEDVVRFEEKPGDENLTTDQDGGRNHDAKVNYIDLVNVFGSHRTVQIVRNIVLNDVISMSVFSNDIDGMNMPLSAIYQSLLDNYTATGAGAKMSSLGVPISQLTVSDIKNKELTEDDDYDDYNNYTSFQLSNVKYFDAIFSNIFPDIRLSDMKMTKKTHNTQYDSKKHFHLDNTKSGIFKSLVETTPYKQVVKGSLEQVQEDAFVSKKEVDKSLMMVKEIIENKVSEGSTKPMNMLIRDSLQELAKRGAKGNYRSNVIYSFLDRFYGQDKYDSDTMSYMAIVNKLESREGSLNEVEMQKLNALRDVLTHVSNIIKSTYRISNATMNVKNVFGDLYTDLTFQSINSHVKIKEELQESIRYKLFRSGTVSRFAYQHFNPKNEYRMFENKADGLYWVNLGQNIKLIDSNNQFTPEFEARSQMYLWRLTSVLGLNEMKSAVFNNMYSNEEGLQLIYKEHIKTKTTNTRDALADLLTGMTLAIESNYKYNEDYNKLVEAREEGLLPEFDAEVKKIAVPHQDKLTALYKKYGIREGSKKRTGEETDVEDAINANSDFSPENIFLPTDIDPLFEVVADIELYERGDNYADFSYRADGTKQYNYQLVNYMSRLYNGSKDIAKQFQSIMKSGDLSMNPYVKDGIILNPLLDSNSPWLLVKMHEFNSIKGIKGTVDPNIHDATMMQISAFKEGLVRSSKNAVQNMFLTIGNISDKGQIKIAEVMFNRFGQEDASNKHFKLFNIIQSKNNKLEKLELNNNFIAYNVNNEFEKVAHLRDLSVKRWQDFLIKNIQAFPGLAKLVEKNTKVWDVENVDTLQKELNNALGLMGEQSEMLIRAIKASDLRQVRDYTIKGGKVVLGNEVSFNKVDSSENIYTYENYKKLKSATNLQEYIKLVDEVYESSYKAYSYKIYSAKFQIANDISSFNDGEYIYNKETKVFNPFFKGHFFAYEFFNKNFDALVIGEDTMFESQREKSKRMGPVTTGTYKITPNVKGGIGNKVNYILIDDPIVLSQFGKEKGVVVADGMMIEFPIFNSAFSKSMGGYENGPIDFTTKKTLINSLDLNTGKHTQIKHASNVISQAQYNNSPLYRRLFDDMFYNFERKVANNIEASGKKMLNLREKFDEIMKEEGDILVASDKFNEWASNTEIANEIREGLIQGVQFLSGSKTDNSRINTFDFSAPVQEYVLSEYNGEDLSIVLNPYQDVSNPQSVRPMNQILSFVGVGNQVAREAANNIYAGISRAYQLLNDDVKKDMQKGFEQYLRDIGKHSSANSGFISSLSEALADPNIPIQLPQYRGSLLQMYRNYVSDRLIRQKMFGVRLNQVSGYGFVMFEKDGVSYTMSEVEAISGGTFTKESINNIINTVVVQNKAVMTNGYKVRPLNNMRVENGETKGAEVGISYSYMSDFGIEKTDSMNDVFSLRYKNGKIVRIKQLLKDPEKLRELVNGDKKDIDFTNTIALRYYLNNNESTFEYDEKVAKKLEKDYQKFISTPNFSPDAKRDIVRVGIENFDDLRGRKEYAKPRDLKWDTKENRWLRVKERYSKEDIAKDPGRFFVEYIGKFQETLKGYAVRIPSSRLAFGTTIEPTFFVQDSGNVMIIPPNMTELNDSDFDIDQLNYYFKSFKNGNISGVKATDDLSKINDVDHIYDYIFENIMTVYNDQDMIKKILVASDVSDLRDASNGLFDKKELSGLSPFMLNNLKRSNETQKNVNRKGSFAAALDSYDVNTVEEQAIGIFARSLSTVGYMLQVNNKSDFSKTFPGFAKDFDNIFKNESINTLNRIGDYLQVALDNAKELVLGNMGITPGAVAMVPVMILKGRSNAYIKAFFSNPAIQGVLAEEEKGNSVQYSRADYRLSNIVSEKIASMKKLTKAEKQELQALVDANQDQPTPSEDVQNAIIDLKADENLAAYKELLQYSTLAQAIRRIGDIVSIRNGMEVMDFDFENFIFRTEGTLGMTLDNLLNGQEWTIDKHLSYFKNTNDEYINALKAESKMKDKPLSSSLLATEKAIAEAINVTAFTRAYPHFTDYISAYQEERNRTDEFWLMDHPVVKQWAKNYYQSVNQSTARYKNIRATVYENISKVIVDLHMKKNYAGQVFNLSTPIELVDGSFSVATDIKTTLDHSDGQVMFQKQFPHYIMFLKNIVSDSRTQTEALNALENMGVENAQEMYNALVGNKFVNRLGVYGRMESPKLILKDSMGINPQVREELEYEFKRLPEDLKKKLRINEFLNYGFKFRNGSISDIMGIESYKELEGALSDFKTLLDDTTNKGKERINIIGEQIKELVQFTDGMTPYASDRRLKDPYYIRPEMMLTPREIRKNLIVPTHTLKDKVTGSFLSSNHVWNINNKIETDIENNNINKVIGKEVIKLFSAEDLALIRKSKMDPTISVTIDILAGHSYERNKEYVTETGDVVVLESRSATSATFKGAVPKENEAKKARKTKQKKIIDGQMSVSFKPNIKLGVQELFESNPELANAVYESVGFKTISNNLTVKENELSINIYRGSFDLKGQDREFYISENGVDKYRFRLFITNSNNIAYISDIYKIDRSDKTINILEAFAKIIETFNSINEYNYELYLDPIISKQGELLRNKLLDVGLVEKVEFIGDKNLNNYDKNKYRFDDSYLYKVNVNADSKITPQQKQQAQQQYSQYLNTIFPDSEVKDIVYHKTPFSFDKFEKPIEERKLNKENKSDAIFFNFENKGFFRSKEKAKTISVVVNTTDNKITNEKIPYATGSKEDIKNILKEDFDSITVNKQGDNKELLVFEPEQIHILGSKQDIQGFKEFVANNKKILDADTSLGNIDSKESIYDELRMEHRTVGAFVRHFQRIYGISIVQETNESIRENYGNDISLRAWVGKDAVHVNIDNVSVSDFAHELTHILNPILKVKDPAMYNKLVDKAQQMIDNNHPFVRIVRNRLESNNILMDDSTFIDEVISFTTGIVSREYARVALLDGKDFRGFNPAYVDTIWSDIDAIVEEHNQFMMSLEVYNDITVDELFSKYAKNIMFNNNLFANEIGDYFYMKKGLPLNYMLYKDLYKKHNLLNDQGKIKTLKDDATTADWLKTLKERNDNYNYEYDAKAEHIYIYAKIAPDETVKQILKMKLGESMQSKSREALEGIIRDIFKDHNAVIQIAETFDVNGEKVYEPIIHSTKQFSTAVPKVINMVSEFLPTLNNNNDSLENYSLANKEKIVNSVFEQMKNNAINKKEYQYWLGKSFKYSLDTTDDVLKSKIEREIYPLFVDFETNIVSKVVELADKYRQDSTIDMKTLAEEVFGKGRVSSKMVSQLTDMLDLDKGYVTAMRYSDLTKYDAYRHLHSDSFTGFNPLVVIHNIDSNGNVDASLYDITSMPLSRNYKHLKGNTLFARYMTPEIYLMNDGKLSNSDRDIRKFILGMTAIQMSKAKSDKKITFRNMVVSQVFGSEIKNTYINNIQDIFNELKIMSYSKGLMEKINNEEIKSLIDNRLNVEKDFKQSFVGQLRAYLEELMSDESKNMYIRKNAEKQLNFIKDGVNESDIITVIKNRMHAIEMKMQLQQAYSDKEYQLLANTLMELDTKGRVINAVNDMEEFKADMQVVHDLKSDILSWVAERVYQTKYVIINQMKEKQTLLKDDFKGLANVYEKSNPANMTTKWFADTGNNYFKHMYKTATAYDENGNTIEITLPEIHWNKTDGDTRALLHSGVLKEEDVKFGEKFVNLIEQRWIDNIYWEKIKRLQRENPTGSFTYTKEDAKNELYSYHGYKKGIIPVMSNTVQSLLFQGNFKLAYEKLGSQLNNIDLLMEEDPNTDKKLNEVSNSFADQLDSDKRLAKIGLEMKDGKYFVFDGNLNKGQSTNLQLIYNYFMLAGIRKEQYEDKVLPVYNSGMSMMKAFNDKGVKQEQNMRWAKWYIDRVVHSQAQDDPLTLGLPIVRTKKAIEGKDGIDDPGALLGGNMNLTSLGRGALKATSIGVLGLSTSVAVKSLFFNEIAMFMNGLSATLAGLDKTNIAIPTLKDLHYAHEVVYGLKGGNEFKKAKQLAYDMQLVEGSERDMIESPNFNVTVRNIFNANVAHYQSWATDAAARMIAMIAVMKKDGSWDAYSYNDKTGEIEYNEKKDGQFYRNGIALKDNGEHVIRQRVLEERIKQGLQKEGDKTLTGGYDVNLMVGRLKWFADKYIIGTMDEYSKPILGSRFLGAAFSQFKMFSWARIFNLAGGTRNIVQGGKYIAVKDENGEWVSEREIIEIEGQLRSIAKGWHQMTTASNMTMAEFLNANPITKFNIIKSMVQVATFSLMVALVHGAFDDDKRKHLAFLYRDIFIGATVTEVFTGNIFPMLNMVQNFAKAATNGDIIDISKTFGATRDIVKYGIEPVIEE